MILGCLGCPETSNITSVTEVWSKVHLGLPVRGAPWWVLLQHSIMLWLFFIAECGITRFLCAMHVFDIPASSSSSRPPLCQILFLLQPPLLSWPMDKNCVLNHSLTHPAYFMPREPKPLCFGIKAIKWTGGCYYFISAVTLSCIVIAISSLLLSLVHVWLTQCQQEVVCHDLVENIYTFPEPGCSHDSGQLGVRWVWIQCNENVVVRPHSGYDW